MWRIREGQSEAARNRGTIVRSDVAVSIELIPALLKSMEDWVKAQNAKIILMPFGHIGDGNIHCNCLVSADDVSDVEPRLLETLYKEVTRLGGSISAEHGVGRLKSRSIQKLKSDFEMRIARSIKNLLDPQSVLNPGVIFPQTDHAAGDSDSPDRTSDFSGRRI
jgi:FAD/FMN-containing dehydrogenase